MLADSAAQLRSAGMQLSSQQEHECRRASSGKIGVEMVYPQISLCKLGSAVCASKQMLGIANLSGKNYF